MVRTNGIGASPRDPPAPGAIADNPSAHARGGHEPRSTRHPTDDTGVNRLSSSSAAWLMTATRAFGVAVANGYAKQLAIKEADGDDDVLDIHAAKARVAALAMLPVVIGQVEWFSALHAAIR